MAPKTSSLDFGVIANDTSSTDYELMERDRKINEKQKEVEKEIEKRREKERKEKGGPSTEEIYRYAIWHCSPRCGFKVDRRDEAAIINHKGTCGWQIELAEQKHKEKESRVDGNCKMRYILHRIENCKTDIENLKRKIEREKSQKLENWQLVISMSEQKIHELENHIFQEEGVELHKLLRHENEITREAAQELYDEYLSLTPVQRSRCQY
jgi:hypothetical protein